MPLTITIQLPNGEVEHHEITAGGKVRLAVGERDGPHGAVWTILATKNEPSFYVMLRQLGALQKWSFHGTGDWRYQWVDTPQAEARARELGHEGGRALDEWRQPPEVGETGWTSAFSICIRHQDLERHDDSRLPKNILWVPPPPEGKARQLHLAILRPTATMIDLKGMVPLCGFGLTGNRHVLILASTHSVADDVNAKITSWLGEGLRRAPGGVVQQADIPRMVVHSIMDDGHRVAWDLAIPPALRQRDPAS